MEGLINFNEFTQRPSMKQTGGHHPHNNRENERHFQPARRNWHHVDSSTLYDST